MKKLTLIGILFLVISNQVSAFEGTWNVDRSECTESGNYINSGYVYNYVRCDVRFKNVVLNHNPIQNTVIIKFLLSSGGYPHPIWDEQAYFSFDCRKSNCWPKNWNHWGKLNVLNGIITYADKNYEGGRSGDGSYEYYFDLNKIDQNHYRIVRRLKYDYSYAKSLDTTQILYLSR